MFSRYHIPSLVRGLKVLEFLSAHPEGCGVSAIAEGAKLPKNSVFRIVATLSDHNYLLRDRDDKTYRLGRKLLGLGYAAVDESSLVEKSVDVLRHLRDVTHETALLAVLAGHEGVILEQVPSSQPVKVVVEIGHRFPMHASAPGKALLAFLPETDRQAILKQGRLTRFTAHTLTRIEAVRADLALARERGYAVDNEEEIEGVTCVSAPVLDRRGHPVAAVWVTGPVTRLGPAQFHNVGNLVKAQARRISERVGHNGSVGTGGSKHEEASDRLG